MLDIRFAKNEDADAIETLLNEYYPDQADLGTIGWIYAEGPGGAIIAFDDDRPIAVSLYYFGISAQYKCKTMEAQLIYVTPDFRNQGLGRVLLKMTALKARNTDCGLLRWNWNASDRQACEYFLTAGATYSGQALFEVMAEDLGLFTQSDSECSGDCDSCMGCDHE